MSNEVFIKVKNSAEDASVDSEVFVKLTQKGRNEYVTPFKYRWVKYFLIDLLNFIVRYVYTIVLSVILFILLFLWSLNYFKILY